MASVRGVNVPMYTTLRRTTVAFTMVIEYMLTGVICGPILMVWTYMCGDLEKTINFPHLFSHCFMVVLLCSCVLAFLLNYIIFLNTTLNSALTQTICGNMKDLFTVGLGWMIFGGLPFRPDECDWTASWFLRLWFICILQDHWEVEEKQKTNFLVLDFAMEVPRRSLAASLSPLRLIDGLPRRRSFNYNQMPEEPIKLAVLKLDGSSFGTQPSSSCLLSCFLPSIFWSCF
ncbi:hypothetical protein F2Q70_00034103 [Brassica cretica]|uniref:Uncharacterized protein n=1 Tax=Brassica cretica TaxID=69181 RepID=A0A8S9JSG5_BRACR|nr:hypothetical protein F2Q70_00034103 [Brassica cretica]